MAIILSGAKLAAILVVGVVVCSAVGIACWFSRDALATSDAEAAAAAARQAANEATTPTPTNEDEFPSGTAPWLNLYLPSYTVPKHYDLTLYPNFYGNNERFYGNVTIEIDVKQATWHLLVHIKRLNVEVTSITNKLTNQNYGVQKEWSYEPNQFWIVKTQNMIEESATVLLTIKFDGSLRDGIVGLYKAFYANNTKAMATSKFQPVDARKAFPCFDEPNLKATFTTTLIHQKDYTALSNMDVDVSESRDDGLQMTRFHKSVPMSTYLACFIVCQCTYDERILSGSGKKFRVYAVEGSEDQIQYALDFGVEVTQYFEQYFGIDYPLPKMDMIAIPDFVSGAMEHWGLITYRETNLLYKEGVSSPSNKQRIAEVVAHELAHMWFGNIVTMDWWDDLWLNEGFATFMSYIGTEPFEPEMQVLTQFASLEAFTVMPEDSVASSHPILVPVKRPEDITAVFDAISYNKGASVIRMLESFVTTDVFKRGLTAFLKRYQYDNAKTYQLWDSINEEVTGTDLDIEHIMDTWTKQSGFPLITVQYDDQFNTITASQQLYKDTSDATTWPTSQYNYMWEVPLHYISSSGASTQDYKWLNSNSASISFPSPVNLANESEWLKFNKETTGYYKVNYPDHLWKRFENLLRQDISNIAAGDRAGLVNDAATLPKYGHLSYNTSLDFLSYMASETHYVPWLSVSGDLFELRDLLDNAEWKSFVQDLVRMSYNNLAWKQGGTHLEKLLRGTITRLACGHEYSPCLEEAKDKFTWWLADPVNNELDGTLRRDVLTYGMMDVTEQQWDKVWDLHNAEPVASAKTEMRRGLARTNDVKLINKYLDYAMDKSKVADQDFFSVINYLAGNDVALPIVWDFVRDNYEQLKSRFGLDNRYFGRMIPSIASQFTTPERLAEVEQFFEDQPDAGAGKRAREQAVETINMAIAWKDQYASDVNQWLAGRTTI